MDRRRLAGVAALVAAALGVTLLTVPEWGEPDSAAGRDRPKAATALLTESAAQTQARNTRKRVEVTALRDATSTTYALPDGSFELTAYGAPVRAMVDGAWQPIDTALSRTEEGWAPRATTSPVVFSAGSERSSAARPAAYAVSRASRTNRTAVTPVADDTTTYTDLVTFTSDGHEITMGWPGTLPAPVIDGSSALYQGVFDGVDLMLTARDNGFSHVLVVHSAEAAADPALASLPYRLTSPDLTFHLDPVTDVVTARDSEGQEIAVSPTPYMWDSAGTPAVTEGADPEPAEPTADPSPTYSEEPGEAPSDNPTGADTEDTAAPDPEDDPTTPSPSPSESPAADPTPSESDADSSGTAQQSTYRTGTGAGTTTVADPTPAEVFALPGLTGPHPGTHRTVGTSALDTPGTTSATLTVTPDLSLLTAPNTVYPVFIDPPLSGKTTNWTTVYKKHPDANFYDGANYNTGTTEARVGYESTTGGLSRSFFRLGWKTSIKGATMKSAYIRLQETYAWSCTARSMELWRTGPISSATTWNNQPSWVSQIGVKSFAHGWNSSCPDDYVRYDAMSVAQDAADAGWVSLFIGLQATDESSSYSWKKFKAESEAAPKLVMEYTRKPAEPTKLHMTPGPDCDTTSPYASVGGADLTFDATGTDPDGDLKYLDFEVWQNGSSTKLYDTPVSVDSAGKASVTLDGLDGSSSKFANGKTYHWRVRGLDATGSGSTYAPKGDGNCGFVYDATRPNSPNVTSTAFPEDDGTGAVWSSVSFGTGGAATFDAQGSKDTVKYEFSYNNSTFNHSATPATAGGTATATLTPPSAGPNVLYVRAVDAASNVSEAFKYIFYVKPRDTADAPGDVTGDAKPDLFVIDQFDDLRLYPAPSNGDIHASLPAAHDEGAVLAEDDAYDSYWTGALITHNGDFLPGDGIQDLVARMPDGRLYVYPGDGYGSVDITRQTEIVLPSGAPDPADLDQILAVGDIDNDDRPDLFAIAGTQYWAFLGYTGGTFSSAVLQNDGTAWADRDLVSVGDHNADGEVDLVYRILSSGRLWLRFGKSDGNGGTTLASLSTSGNSLNGTDTAYASSGWTTSTVRLLMGGPDVNLDGIPDMWAVMNDDLGTVRFYRGGASTVGAYTTVVSSGWTEKGAVG
ncbi:VCBS repeat-containing protein [Streptomyces sp. NBC_01451]|uniref:VCBS repeat-containing protein n=1 Tax=Streptomyces sp. NBC_01451 TaxID=2903872 RepID=UPI002E2EF10D|nr:VCBS repeat-containing protein [Streptomyces sp. NBC_01451]